MALNLGTGEIITKGRDIDINDKEATNDRKLSLLSRRRSRCSKLREATI